MARSSLTCTLLLTSLLAWGATGAQAQEPFDLDAGVRVSDSSQVLGNTSSLEDSIGQLASSRQINLFVVTIDRFENPSSSSSWVKSFAQTNNFGSNDVVLVIATEARQAYFLAGSTSVLSASAQESIYQKHIYPQLAQSDYGAAAQAAVTGIEEELGGSSLTGPLVGVSVLLGVGATAGAGGYLLSRSRRQGRGKAAGPASYQQQPATPLADLGQLRSQAGQLLVSTDDAIAHSLQEVEYARLQYGDESVAPYLAAIEQAKGHMQRSFQLQKQLEDDIPDTEADQRAWLGEIIGRCQQAQAALDQQVENFKQLRRLEEQAPGVLANLTGRLAELEARLPVAQSQYEALTGRYLPSALAPVADNLAEARSRLDFARQEAESARQLMDSDRSAAIMDLRAAEEAAGQAAALVKSLEEAGAGLEAVTASLDSALPLTDRDIAQAKELAAAGLGSRSQLLGAAAGAEAALLQIRTQRSAARLDPNQLKEQLAQARSELDQALGQVRQLHEQEQAARTTLSHTLISAQTQVARAQDYVWSRRGGVQGQARTHLREAERHLAEAQRLHQSQPIEALSQANEAIRLASSAQKLAQADVHDFQDRHRGGGLGGGDLNSAMLGGILLGTLLGGGNRAPGPGPSSWGGSFGGGFGGGHRPGGFGGGSFGSGGGAGGNF